MGKCASRNFGLIASLTLVADLCGAAPAFGDCGPGTVELRSPSGSVVRFSVEIADDEAERAQGLMNRDHMATSAGMLFAYERPRHPYFWMKNTLIPLDMIFVAPGGKILRIEANTVPYSLEPVPSGGDVEAVLELAGGRAAELAINHGDQVDWKR